MGVVQIAAMVVTLAEFACRLVASAAGWVAHMASTALVSSAHLVTDAPWLTARVPPPGVALVVVYYAALTVAVAGRGPTARVAASSCSSRHSSSLAAEPISPASLAATGPNGCFG